MEKASYLGVVRVSDQVVLASVFTNNVASSQKTAMERFFLEAVQNRKGKIEDRRKERVTIGVLPGDLYLYIEYKFAFGGWLKHGVSDTTAWAFMKDAALLTKNCPNISSAGSLGLQPDLKKPFRDMMRQFGISQKSAVDNAQSKIDHAQAVMQDNMRKMVENQKDLESLEESSVNMTRTASLYQTNARALRRNIEMRTFRIQLMIGVVLTAIIIYIIVQFA
eukprot:GEMP01054800.1.p1 GENE.GEMP01054800.1~~GEMP01054800.1.p1  ORF type:complete len:221 (+),score=41.32 GEMP01054800.1:43-705(+)